KSFIRYIKGESSEYGGSPKTACRDTTLPIEKRAIDIQYDLYFGYESTSWNGSGVSFLDISKKGHALGVAYLLTREQFDHVAAQENNGRFPGNGEWYNCKKSLGEIDGYELVTVTNDKLRKQNKPSEEYLKTIKLGIRENWSEMSEEDIKSYLESCIREF
ncbi:MAG: gamma-glutamylcyclotransferase, partial [Methanobrevibacter sp.]|nr:gamma-glutamylcyclotransferase [Methanobrevibacter sp.]